MRLESIIYWAIISGGTPVKAACCELLTYTFVSPTTLPGADSPPPCIGDPIDPRLKGTQTWGDATGDGRDGGKCATMGFGDCSLGFGEAGVPGLRLTDGRAMEVSAFSIVLLAEIERGEVAGLENVPLFLDLSGPPEEVTLGL